MSDLRRIRIEVNGKNHECDVETRLHLADFLRHQLGFTGTHVGCEHGVCGACTVLVDGLSVRSCLMFAVQLDGHMVTTIEGLGSVQALSKLQQAFHEEHGLQCGFCTPGILMTLVELLKENPFPTESEVRDRLSGNICRCTGYESIVDAALLAAKLIAEGDSK